MASDNNAVLGDGNLHFGEYCGGPGEESDESTSWDWNGYLCVDFGAVYWWGLGT